MLNYDPDGLPNLDPKAMERARELGLTPVHIICDEPGAQVDDDDAVSFFGFVAFMPRQGEVVELDDGKKCRVKHVIHRTVTAKAFDGVMLVPNILAVRIDNLNE